jgi:hypothetical protein
MLNARCEDEHIPCVQWIRAAKCLKENFALEHVYGDRSLGVMRRQISTRRNANDGEPQRSFLYECACAPSVPGEEYGVNHSLVLGQMPDEDFAFNSSVHR